MNVQQNNVKYSVQNNYQTVKKIKTIATELQNLNKSQKSPGTKWLLQK